MTIKRFFSFVFIGSIMIPMIGYSQSKVGTSAAQFLGISVGARATAMGGAFGAVAEDASALYWNPAGVARTGLSEVYISHTEWLVETDFNWAGMVIALDRNNAVGVHFTQLNYGEDIVTTIEDPMGTGDRWSAMDIAAGITYARNLTDFFSIGGSVKYINQRIWNESASAIGFDIGLLFITGFNDMKLGVSISNFGTEMKMDGKDLSIIHDLDPNSYGSNDKIPARLETDSFVLPLLFRVGLSMDLIRSGQNRLLTSVEASYPNDEEPFMSTGLEYTWNDFLSIRGGYRSLFMPDPVETWTIGGGIKVNLSGSVAARIDYVYQEFGVFSNVQSFAIGINF